MRILHLLAAIFIFTSCSNNDKEIERIRAIYETEYEVTEIDGDYKILNSLAKKEELFDGKGNLLRRIQWHSYGGFRRTSYEYGENGKEIKENDYHSDIPEMTFISEFIYDSHGMLVNKTTSGFGDLIENDNYYYLNGNLIKKVEKITGIVYEYRYDDEGYLIEEKHTDDSGESIFDLIKYDSYDNNDSVLKSHHYRNLDRYSKTSINDSALDKINKYEYDKYGNRIKWVEFDILFSDTLFTTITTNLYEYNQFGHWIKKTEFWDGKVIKITKRQFHIFNNYVDE